MAKRWPFSNFNTLNEPMVYGGVSYPTVEHFYQAMKTADPKLRATLAALSTPGQAKRMGQTFTPWQPKFDRLKVMDYALRRKFAPGTPEAETLIAFTEPIIEWNYWHDTFWGCCTCGTHNQLGDNNLGRLLTIIREELTA